MILYDDDEEKLIINRKGERERDGCVRSVDKSEDRSQCIPTYHFLMGYAEGR